MQCLFSNEVSCTCAGVATVKPCLRTWQVLKLTLMPALAIRFALHCWLAACLQINFLKEQGWAQEGYQCSLCWANGEVLIVTTVDAFNAHTAEVHGGESVPEVAESEVQFEEGGGGLDKEIELVEEVAESPLDSTYLVEEVVGGESVPEVAEVEVQLEEGGGDLDKEIELMEEVAEPGVKKCP